MLDLKRKVVRNALKSSLITAPLLYLGFFLDAGINSYSANITGQFFNFVLENQHTSAQSMLGVMFLTLLVSVLVLPLLALGTSILFFHFSLKYDFYVTSNFYCKTFESMGRFSGGTIVQKLFRDPGQLLFLLISIPSKMLAQISALIVMIYFMMRISPALCLVCIGLGGLGAICPLFFMRRLAQLDEAKKSFSDQTAGIELEMVQNKSFFRNYGIEDFLPGEQKNAYSTYYKGYLKHGVWTDGLAIVLPECFLLLGNISFLLIGMHQALKGGLGAGNLIAFFSYLTLVVSLFTQLYHQGRQMVQLPDSISRVADLIGDAEPSKGIPSESWKNISISGLSYQYAENGTCLTYCDFDIPRNSLTEIKGDNGAGKTTLIRLLCGLLFPTSGAVLVDSLPLSDMDLKRWREEITCVEQIPAIFTGTLRENIHLGNLSASAEQMEQVLARLHLTEHADRELTNAQQLSGGELKKISLGRALLRNTNIMIFDEPFEYLDANGRQVLMEMLTDKSKTRIFIQHNHDQAITADRVIQL